MADLSEKPIHPGEVLWEVYMKPTRPAIAVSDLADALDISARELSSFIRGKRTMTMPLAVRLAMRFRTSPDFWLGLQEQYNGRLRAHTNHHVHRLKR